MAIARSNVDNFIQSIPCSQDAHQLLAQLLSWLTREWACERSWALLHEEASGRYACRVTFPFQSKSTRHLPARSSLVEWLKCPEFRLLDSLDADSATPHSSTRVWAQALAELSSWEQATLAFPLHSRGKLIGIILAHRDRSIPRTPPRALAALKEVALIVGLFVDKLLIVEEAALTGQFCHGFLHDLPSLLTPVSTLLQLCEAGSSKWPQIADLLPSAQRSLQSLQECIRQATRQEHRSSSRPASEPLRPLVMSALSLVQARCTERSLQLEVQVPPDLCVALDRVLALRLLLNLCSNAAKAAPRGSIIRLGAHRLPMQPNEPDHILFWIRNAGAAPSTKELASYLNISLCQTTVSAQEAGRGVGLAICHRIATMHGGSISFHEGPRGEVEVRVELLAGTGCQHSPPTPKP